ncbi:MAG: acylphosphatase [Candidatus Omnitrophica bacterium]|nr:acylphosphatase [Candidatus Omnitrophota bacterium]
MIRAHILYSGTVQGVGFRFATQRQAQSLDLKGWVKNLPDGRVEICAEGGREDIERLCEGLEKNFEGYVRNKDISFSETQGHEQGFRIV